MGGGQAGLACAIRLLQLLEDDPELTESLGEVPVAVVEKGKVAGAHQLSGAVMNPSAIKELFPDDDSWPNYGPVEGETVYFMPSRKRAIPLKPTPPPFRNHGNYVVSVAELNRWLAEKAEEAGAYMLTETTRTSCSSRTASSRRPHGRQGPRQGGRREGQLRAGLRCRRPRHRARRGLLGPPDRRGAEGARPRAEGPAGVGARRQGGLGGREPLHKVIHTLGWPLRPGAKYKEFGGSWIYGMNREGETPKVSIGFVVGLDYTDARLSVHDVLQEFKLHPLVRKILAGGKRVAWGAKAIPEGGYWAMPKLHAPGMVICGDAGGMVNVPRAQGRPLRDPVRDARRRDDLPAAQGAARPTSRPTRRPCTTRRSARTSGSRAT